MTDLPDNKKPRVVILTKWYPDKYDPQLGVFIQKHATAIANRAQVSVFYARAVENAGPGSIQEEVTAENGINEYRYYYPAGTGIMGKAVGAVRYLACWKRFVKQADLRNNPPDLLHAYILLRTGCLALFEKIRYGTPYVVSEQWSGYLTGKFEQQSFIWKSIWRLVTKKSAGVSAVSEHLRNRLVNLTRRNDLQVFYNVIEKNPIPSPAGDSDRIRVLMVADLVDDIKNISGVLRAFSRVRMVHPSMELDIIGGGKDEGMLKALTAELGLDGGMVRFEGMQPNRVVYERLQQCSFLVMNSRFETFSSVCAEALCCGKPVIATRCGGPQEFITSEQGILIAPDHDEELVEALKRMANCYRDYDPAALSRYASEKFGAPAVGKHIADWYISAIRQAMKAR
jgi:glycosyltransferase involved in cell wall biosynthesis